MLPELRLVPKYPLTHFGLWLQTYYTLLSGLFEVIVSTALGADPAALAVSRASVDLQPVSLLVSLLTAVHGKTQVSVMGCTPAPQRLVIELFKTSRTANFGRLNVKNTQTPDGLPFVVEGFWSVLDLNALSLLPPPTFRAFRLQVQPRFLLFLFPSYFPLHTSGLDHFLIFNVSNTQRFLGRNTFRVAEDEGAVKSSPEQSGKTRLIVLDRTRLPKHELVIKTLFRRLEIRNVTDYRKS